MFDWDEHNERKVRRHGITPVEAEEVMTNDPLFQHPQQADDEERELYYGETRTGRMLAVCMTIRSERIRIVTAYELDAGQIREYNRQRIEDRHDETQDDR